MTAIAIITEDTAKEQLLFDKDNKPDFAVVSPSTQALQDTVLSLLRLRVAVALANLTDDSYQFISGAAKTASRNHVPLVLLGSWRYIPAVAALKELSDSNCLGDITAVSATAISGSLNGIYRSDALSWLAPECSPAPDASTPEHDIRITLSGSAGTATADFSLDGSKASFSTSILGHTHSRSIQPADPKLSELAVLKLCLDKLPPNTKVKKLPMLLTFGNK